MTRNGKPIADHTIPADGGFIPQTGIFDVTSWAAFLGVEVCTFRTWCRDAKVRCRRPGGGKKGKVFIAAEDLLKAFPAQQWDASE